MTRYQKHEYSLTFENDDKFGPFVIEALGVGSEKQSNGPYRVMFKGVEIYRNEYHSECKYQIEEIVREYRECAKEFCEKWGLPGFPDKNDIWPEK